MSEIDFQIVIFVNTDEFATLNILLPFVIVSDVRSLEQMFQQSLKNNTSKLRRYIILLLKSMEKDGDHLYSEWEENPQILKIFNTWDEDFIPPVKQTKLYYIPKKLINLMLPLTYIQFVKIEANKCAKLDQISLSKIYLRKAQKVKELLMTNIRAEPSHILVIPLNTNTDNLVSTIKCIRQSCAKFGYSSITISTADEYIPKDNTYDRLPYGQLLFENEDPKMICRWIRVLCPIRMYLYGNESIITSELSKQMILNEPDPSIRRIVNDDDYCIFIENELVRDDVKWNFFARHAQSWQIKNLTPINLNQLNNDIRFRSSLRRAHVTYASRMTTITAQILDWYDLCIEQKHLENEFKLPEQQTKVRSVEIDKISHHEDQSLTLNNNQRKNYFPAINRIYNIFIWLSNDYYSIEYRFHMEISPSQWNYFSNVNECQTFIYDQQSQTDRRIYLISNYSLAAELFAYEHATRISVAYIYSTHDEFFNKWTNKFPPIRGIYKNFDALFKQFSMDLTKNIELTSVKNLEKDNEDPLPICFNDSDSDRFQRCRIWIEILLNLPRTLQSKQEMIKHLRLISDDNENVINQINNFEENYHSNAAIHWYTKDTFLYRLVNKALRNQDIELILTYRFFIIDLYQNLAELHQQIIKQNEYSQTNISTYYRGQRLSVNEIEQFKEHIHGLVSLNTFLSTSLSLDIALMFAGASTSENQAWAQPVLFCIEVDSSIENTRPYANINFYSVYEDEDEVLFSIGSIFRIESIEYLSNNDTVIVIRLTMIDDKNLPKSNVLNELASLFSEKKFSDPIYALVGLTPLIKDNEQANEIKLKLEEIGIKFFENTDELDKYMEIIRTIQSFVIFINNQLFIPGRYQQTKLISFSENDTHFNDLIYQLLYEMEHHQGLEESIKAIYTEIANNYCSLNDKNLYVQLLVSSSSRKQSEERLKNKLLPSTSLMTFYQIEPCINFLQSIINENKLGNAILILQIDETNIDEIIDRFEPISSVKFIYICSKDALKIASRRIIRGQFQTENDLYGQICLDNLYQSFADTNEQIELCRNKTKAKQSLDQTEHFYELFNEHRNLKNTVDY